MFLNVSYFELLGYLASLIIVISLLMSSIIKLRWINLIGALIFCVYGFLINAAPVCASNAAIAAIDIYYLYRIYAGRQYFHVLEIKKGDLYLKKFLEFYRRDIKYYFPDFNFDCCEDENTVSFYVLRDMVTAAIFIAKKNDDGALMVLTDFAAPEYRDFKIGRYIYCENEKYFSHLGYNKFCAETSSAKHEAYLIKMGFTLKAETGAKRLYVRPIQNIDIFKPVEFKR